MDVNGDGWGDLLGVNVVGGSVGVLLGDGRGGFGALKTWTLRDSPMDLAVADWDGDGRQDVMVVHRGGWRDNVSVLFGDGQGGLARWTSLSVGNLLNGVLSADFNRDGIPDAALSDGSGQVHILLGNGQGSFASAATAIEPGSEPAWPAVGDVNLDGNPDLLVPLQKRDAIAVLLGDGRGGFSSTVRYAVDSMPQSVSVGDWNGDGKPDLVAANLGGGSVSMLLGDGAGGFGGRPS